MNAHSASAQTRKRKGDRRAADVGTIEFSKSLSEIVGRLLSEGRADVAHAADSVGMSKRTLQRRLAESGTGFAHLVDDARLARAISLIDDPGTTLAKVAEALGYSDAANFARAFRRWTGLSPGSGQ